MSADAFARVCEERDRAVIEAQTLRIHVLELSKEVANVRGRYEHERMQKLGTRGETDDLVTTWLIEAEDRVRCASKILADLAIVTGRTRGGK